MSNNNSIIEALILASPEPIPARKIAELLEGMAPSKINEAVEELNQNYAKNGNSFRIRTIAGGYQIYIIPEFVGYVEELFSRQRKMRLTRAALEVMAIIAYRQPVTKTDIELIRGVASDGVLHNLLEKKLITITGRSEAVGRPLQYGTTDEFLKFFGLNKLEDLPKMTEIEELIRAAEPSNQTELNLADPHNEERMKKLNIADGTYRPDDACDADESMSEFSGGAEREEIIQPIDEIEPAEYEEKSDVDEEFDKSEESEIPNKTVTNETAETDNDEEMETDVIVDVDAT